MELKGKKIDEKKNKLFFLLLVMFFFTSQLSAQNNTRIELPKNSAFVLENLKPILDEYAYAHLRPTDLEDFADRYCVDGLLVYDDIFMNGHLKVTNYIEQVMEKISIDTASADYYEYAAGERRIYEIHFDRIYKTHARTGILRIEKIGENYLIVEIDNGIKPPANDDKRQYFAGIGISESHTALSQLSSSLHGISDKSSVFFIPRFHIIMGVAAIPLLKGTRFDFGISGTLLNYYTDLDEDWGVPDSLSSFPYPGDSYDVTLKVTKRGLLRLDYSAKVYIFQSFNLWKENKTIYFDCYPKFGGNTLYINYVFDNNLATKSNGVANSSFWGFGGELFFGQLLQYSFFAEYNRSIKEYSAHFLTIGKASFIEVGFRLNFTDPIIRN